MTLILVLKTISDLRKDFPTWINRSVFIIYSQGNMTKEKC